MQENELGYWFKDQFLRENDDRDAFNYSVYDLENPSDSSSSSEASFLSHHPLKQKTMTKQKTQKAGKGESRKTLTYVEGEEGKETGEKKRKTRKGEGEDYKGERKVGLDELSFITLEMEEDSEEEDRMKGEEGEENKQKVKKGLFLNQSSHSDY